MTKYYRSRYLSHSLTLHLDDGSRYPILFVNGEYSTDNPDVAAHIESLDSFGTVITALDPKEVKAREAADTELQAKLQETRDKAEKEAKDKAAAAERTHADLIASKKANDEAEAARNEEHNRLKADIEAREKAEAKATEADRQAKLDAIKKQQQREEEDKILAEAEAKEKAEAEAKAKVEDEEAEKAAAATAGE